jgi:outer membrane PBP1 activator LpoA protein
MNGTCADAIQLSTAIFRPYFNIVGNYMTRQISFASYVLVLVSAFAFVGCGAATGDATFEAPSDEITADQQQESDDYEKQMEADNLRQQSEGTK